MSSLAAARADNFYIPNDPDQLTAYAGKAPGNLGARAKKQDQGILVIRFEMPYNVVCNGCGHMIAKGVRFNAEKKAVGKYFSTKIWSFTMRSPCCKEVIEVHTDPKAAEYILVQGARRKVEEFTAEAVETLELRSKEEVEQTRANPFLKLETGLADIQRARATAPSIAELQQVQTERSKNDYELNKQLRRAMREQRHAAQSLEKERVSLHLPGHLRLLPATAEDEEAVRAVRFGIPGGRFERDHEKRTDRRHDILRAPLLRPPESVKVSAAARSVHEAADKRAELMAKRRKLEQNGVRFGAPAAGGGDAFGGAFGGSSAAAARVSVRAVPKDAGRL